jgi:carotenoid cleavage dioxygenase-like enzyme
MTQSFVAFDRIPVSINPAQLATSWIIDSMSWEPESPTMYFLLDKSNGKTGSHSFLVALDGKTMEQIARADMPQLYGLGPHGTFIESN